MKKTKQHTLILPVAYSVVAVLSLLLVFSLPFEQDFQWWAKLLILVGSSWVAMITWSFAFLFVRFALKAIVESMAATLLLINIVAILLSVLFWKEIRDIAGEADDPLIYSLISVAIVLFLFNVFVAVIIYPLAQVAGTNFLDDDPVKSNA